MIKLSDFFSKQILSIYDGTSEGIIKTAYFDKKFKKLKYFILFDDLDNIIEEKALATDKIYKQGENAIMVKNNTCLNIVKTIESKLEKKNPINSQVFDTFGKYLGVITDVYLDEKLNTQSIILNNAIEISIDKYISNQDNIFIIQNLKNTISIKNFRPKTNFPKSQDKNDIFILKSENEIINEKLKESAKNNILPLNSEIKKINLPHKKFDTQLPDKITSNVSFLLGRKATKNIYSQSNEILVKKNSTINSTNIEIARKFGKIKELATYSM